MSPGSTFGLTRPSPEAISTSALSGYLPRVTRQTRVPLALAKFITLEQARSIYVKDVEHLLDPLAAHRRSLREASIAASARFTAWEL